MKHFFDTYRAAQVTKHFLGTYRVTPVTKHLPDNYRAALVTKQHLLDTYRAAGHLFESQCGSCFRASSILNK